ncbi:MAG: ABC transporter substrate-binding protein [Holosporales bacterium]|jgi:trehalose/maltose transport system substrate-binding protein|nr:ABC transporter substrate-binding protein [Holosporales bacterium]
MKHLCRFLFCALAFAFGQAPLLAEAGVILKMTCRAKGQEAELCEAAIKEWARKKKEETGTDVKVEIIKLPQSSSESYAFTQQLLGSQAEDVDIYQVDTTWSVFLAPHVVPLNAHFSPEEMAAHFPVAIQSNTIQGNLVAIPWYADIDVLFYRLDVLEKRRAKPPTTWEELAKTAQMIQDYERRFDGNTRFCGYVFRGKSYEGLMCHVVEWIESFGGNVFSPGSLPQEDRVIEAFTFLSELIPKVSPPGVLNYTEEEVRGVFQLGEAAFAHNWPYMWALAQMSGSPVEGKVGITVLPRGKADRESVSVLGGWGLCVSKYSKHQDLAVDLVRWLTRHEEQKRRAVKASYLPTIVTLYGDPEVLAKNPFFLPISKALSTAIVRPAAFFGRLYPQVSAAVTSIAQSVLSKELTPAEGAKQLIQAVETFKQRAQSSPEDPSAAS